MRTRLIAGIALAACAAFAALAAAVQPAEATYPGTTAGRLAFGIAVEGNTDVYSVMPNGEALRRLTDDPGFDACAAYSADGKWIAWCGAEGSPPNRFAIWVMKQNGTEKRRVTSAEGRAIFPDFSPDGSTIAYSEGVANVDIYTIGVEGGTPTRLTDDAGFDAYPAYSPDGSKIVFVSNRTGINQVWLMDADGTDETQLTFDAVPKDQVPDWSPDGSRIAYATRPGLLAGGDIWLIDADGSDQRSLTSGPEREYGAAWSPEGDRIAFLEFGERTVYTIRIDGTDRRAVHPLGLQSVPGWQPRGDRLE